MKKIVLTILAGASLLFLANCTPEQCAQAKKDLDKADLALSTAETALAEIPVTEIKAVAQAQKLVDAALAKEQLAKQVYGQLCPITVKTVNSLVPGPSV